jgi:hypothetical protein
MTIVVEIVGTDRMRARLQRAIATLTGVGPNMYRQLQRTSTKAVEYCPIDTGALRASRRVDVDRDGADISFGGPMAPYAVHVHEDLGAHHPVGQAKFLERAVVEDSALIADAVAQDLKDALK